MLEMQTRFKFIYCQKPELVESILSELFCGDWRKVVVSDEADKCTVYSET
jgi:hypothetical protein